MTSFPLEESRLEFADQTVFAGTKALEKLVPELSERGIKRPLLVTDTGIAALGMASEVTNALRAGGMSPSVFDSCKPNPGLNDIAGIAAAFLSNDCDACIGFGGGGPLDAAKGGMALVAQQRVVPDFDSSRNRDVAEFVNSCRTFADSIASADGYTNAVPLIAAIPTTAGTGSDGGKSAVICDSKGQKVVFGNPCLMPALAALAPQLTVGKPAGLTAATGIDAMFHSLEAYLVPTPIMTDRDGMTAEEIKYCDSFATAGISMVLRNLGRATTNSNDLAARLHMQIAALYGAKAFRKGDLGGVHATAHALGAAFHLHHGECIARMSVPVLAHSETRDNYSAEAKEKSEFLRDLVNGERGTVGGAIPTTLSSAVADFLSEFSGAGVRVGISDLVDAERFESQIDELVRLATSDGCQTNPVALGENDYRQIFTDAAEQLA